MRYGFHTILWGRRIESLDHVLEVIEKASFAGVEIAQPVDQLGLRGETDSERAKDLAKRLHSHNLELVGLAGGTLDSRRIFAELYASERAKMEHKIGQIEVKPPPYLYSDESDYEKVRPTLLAGGRVAVHTMHPGKLARWSDAKAFLRESDRLLWLPDTAHLFISRSELIEAIMSLDMERIAAVHIKDWRSVYGRFSHRYARGFIELGDGEVPIEKVLTYLDRMNYNGWVITELDYSRTTAENSVFKCAEWLWKKNRVSKPLAVVPLQGDEVSLTVDPLLGSLQSMWWPDAASGIPGFYDRAAATLVKCLVAAGINCADVGIWEFNPERESLPSSFAVVGVASALLRPEFEFTKDESKAALKISLETQDCDEPRRFFRSDSDPALKVLFEKYRLTEFDYALAVPVYNQFNSHQLRFVIQFAFPPDVEMDDQLAIRVCGLFRLASEAYVSERSAVAASTVNHLIPTITEAHKDVPLTSDSLLKKLVEETRGLLRCEGVTIFLNRTGDVLKVGQSTGLLWNPEISEDQRQYPKDVGFPGRVLAHQQPLLVRNPEHLREKLKLGSWRSREDVDSDHNSCVLAPMFGRDDSILGVLRCRNKLRNGKPRDFCDDDLSVIDAILRAAVPDLEILLADDRRQFAYHRMMHEVRQPVVTIENIAHQAKSEWEDNGKPAIFAQDWLGDIELYARIVNNVVDDFDVAELTDRPVLRRLERVFLFGDIIAAAARLAQAMLQERSISFRKVDYGRRDDWKVPPPLYLDKGRFFQVFFNLFTNAIKYAQHDPTQFGVRIYAGRVADGWTICIEDNGIGVPRGWEEKIFRSGIRAPNAETVNVQGLGIGLTVVKKIIEAHRGTIRLTHNAEPTQFTIWLPHLLQNRWKPDERG